MKSEVVRTCLVLLAVWSDGFHEGCVAAGLPDLAYWTQSTTDQIATVYTWRSVAGVLGSLAIGRAIDRYDGVVVLGLALLAQAVFTLLTPLCPHLVGLSLTSAVAAFFLGGITSGSFVVIYRTWKKHLVWARAIVQVQGVFFIFGSAVAPLAVSPFLGIVPIETEEMAQNSTGSSLITIQPTTKYITNVHWAFVVSAGIAAIGALLSFVSVVVFGLEKVVHDVDVIDIDDAVESKDAASYNVCHVHGNGGTCDCQNVQLNAKYSNEDNKVCGVRKSSSDSGSDTSTLSKKVKTGHVTWRKKSVRLPVSMYLVFMFIFGGLEMTILSLTMTYTEVYLHWSVRLSALSSTVLNAVRVVFVIITIFIINLFFSFNMIIIDMIVIAIGSSFWLIFFKYTHIITWVGIAVVGAGTANVFATSLSVANDIVPISGTLAALFNMAYCLGGLTFPPLAGLMLHNVANWTFPLLVLCCSIVCLAFAILSKTSLRFYKRKSAAVANSPADEESPLIT